MFKNSVKLKPDGDMWYVEMVDHGIGADPMFYPAPPRHTRKVQERLLEEKGYRFMYKSKLGDWEVWGIPVKED